MNESRVCGTKRKRRIDEVELERICDAVARRLSDDRPGDTSRRWCDV